MEPVVKRWFAVVLSLLACGCSSTSTMIAPLAPAKYETLGEVTGQATGSLGILGTAYYFIPMGLNGRMESAYSRALESAPGSTGLVNVTLSENWYWWVVVTARSVEIKGDAIQSAEGAQ